MKTFTFQADVTFQAEDVDSALRMLREYIDRTQLREHFNVPNAYVFSDGGAIQPRDSQHLGWQIGRTMLLKEMTQSSNG